MITGLVGITLWTDDLERLFNFYHDTLQLPLHSRHEDFIAFQLGDIRFNIGRHDRVGGPSKDPFRIMAHLGVDDIHQEHERLQANGVEFIRPPEQEHHRASPNRRGGRRPGDLSLRPGPRASHGPIGPIRLPWRRCTRARILRPFVDRTAGVADL